jgi:hypothetical protein
MAVWQDKRISCICSQMPNLTIMATNAAAAVDQSRFSQSDNALLTQYAEETSRDYCAGCGRLCSEALANQVPINDVMRSLMYAHSYQDLTLARDTFKSLPAQVRTLLRQLDYRTAEQACPRNLPIARMMQEAAVLLT